MERARDLEDRIAEFARRQHGVVTRTQLRESGLRPGAIRRRAAAGRLRPLHRGVYLVGPWLPPRCREMAAALACGPGALISHRSGAAMRGWLAPLDDAVPIDVLVAAERCPRHPGIRIRRAAEIREADRDGWTASP